MVQVRARLFLASAAISLFSSGVLADGVSVRMDPGDPAVRFSDTRVGHVLFASSRSDNCRRVLFDNRTGSSYEAKEIFCGQRPDQAVEVGSSDRLTGLRQFFRR